MKLLYKPLLVLILLLAGCSSRSDQENESSPDKLVLSRTALQDKIKGGWAGQTIGVTYGGPTEFKFQGRMIKEYEEIPWGDDYIDWYFDEHPGLYDDIYMDLSFVDVIEKHGIDAPVDSFASSFANAGFRLWHANQAARYAILHGINPPASGNWQNNPHADCIDFQIESDFAGLMSPGMVNAATGICDKVGHIMNYGDGWYGGVYVASMYSLAFTSDDIEYIVKEGLKSIPEESNYYKCMSAVIQWHEQYPDDWKKTWFEIENADWKESCPRGIHKPFNIEATVNSAYVLIGLLYGGGDFSRTLEIATRCGQDSDCNPSTCGGILGVVMGYENIPEKWLTPLRKVEDRDFDHTTMSLNDTYRIGMKHALAAIQRNGGEVKGDSITIPLQAPKAVKLEQTPDYKRIRTIGFEDKGYNFNYKDRSSVRDFDSLQFQGSGLIINGEVTGDEGKNDNYVAEVAFIIDGKTAREMKLPLSFTKRSVELFWTHDLEEGRHVLTIKWLNPVPEIDIALTSAIELSNAPLSNTL